MPTPSDNRPCAVPATMATDRPRGPLRHYSAEPRATLRAHTLALPLALLLSTAAAHAQLGGTMPMSTVTPMSSPVQASARPAAAAASRSGASPAAASVATVASVASVASGGITATAPRSLMSGALRVRTSVDAGNTTINEYATSDGRIVAYTWQGPTMPDLKALLGPYLDSYRAGAVERNGAVSGSGDLHASRRVRPDVIVESGGPMRSYIGRAWLPGALPPGVGISDLQ